MCVCIRVWVPGAMHWFLVTIPGSMCDHQPCSHDLCPMQVNNPDFNVERSIIVASPNTASVEVSFEPSHLGDSQALLTLSSNVGGEYFFPLFGHCLPPKPQGPFVIRPGHSIAIPFKNIFSHFTQFKFAVDNPAFTVRPGDTIKPGKTYNISVTYDGKLGEAGVVKVGKLTVTNVIAGKGKAGRHQSEISWVFYLRGALPSESQGGSRH